MDLHHQIGLASDSTPSPAPPKQGHPTRSGSEASRACISSALVFPFMVFLSGSTRNPITWWTMAGVPGTTS
jgi:hypothetical protein